MADRIYLTLKDAQKEYGISRDKVYRLKKQGMLKTYKLGGNEHSTTYLKAEEVEGLFEEA